MIAEAALAARSADRRAFSQTFQITQRDVLDRCSPGPTATRSSMRIAGGHLGRCRDAFDLGPWPPGGRTMADLTPCMRQKRKVSCNWPLHNYAMSMLRRLPRVSYDDPSAEVGEYLAALTQPPIWRRSRPVDVVGSAEPDWTFCVPGLGIGRIAVAHLTLSHQMLELADVPSRHSAPSRMGH
jgi:hypothetical protein